MIEPYFVGFVGYPRNFRYFPFNSYRPGSAGHSSALVYMEAQIDYIVEAISKLLQFGWKSLDVRPEVQARYNDDIQQRLQSTTSQISSC